MKKHRFMGSASWVKRQNSEHSKIPRKLPGKKWTFFGQVFDSVLGTTFFLFRFFFFVVVVVVEPYNFFKNNYC